ncbi:MAG: head GIN domain-containing protein [Bacteroidia bacterium]
MKHFFTLATALLLVATFTACDDDWAECYRGNGIYGENEVIIDNFESIEIESSIDVELIQDTANFAIISGDDNIIDLVSTRVIGSRLVIEYRNDVNCVRPTQKTVMQLHFTQIKEIVIDGSGDIYGLDTVNTERLDIKINGSGNVKLDANIQNLLIEVDGSGDVDIEGNGNSGFVLIKGSGNVDIYDFEMRSLGIEVNGSGDSRAFVQDELKVWVNGSGDVWYRGECDLVIDERNGSGEVRKI